MGRRVEPPLSQASTSAAAPRPSLQRRKTCQKTSTTHPTTHSLDTPDDERLATTAIASSEDAVDTGRVLLGRRLDVRPSVLLDVKVLDDVALGTKETKRKEDELGREEFLGSRYFLHLPASTAVLGPFYADSVQALELTILDDEILGGDAVLAGIYGNRPLSFQRYGIRLFDSPLPKWAATSVCP